MKLIIQCDWISAFTGSQGDANMSVEKSDNFRDIIENTNDNGKAEEKPNLQPVSSHLSSIKSFSYTFPLFILLVSSSKSFAVFRRFRSSANLHSVLQGIYQDRNT